MHSVSPGASSVGGARAGWPRAGGFGPIFSLELRRRLRQPATWLYVALYFATGLVMMLLAAGAFESASLGMGTGGRVKVNSPATLTELIATIAQLGLLIVAGVAGQAVEQDFRHGTYALVFTTPIRPAGYLGGRLLAILCTLVLVHAAIGLGCFAGTLWPGLDAALVGPQRALAYVQPYLLLVLPNLLLLATVFFALGALSRRMRPVWVAAVVIFVGSLIASVLARKAEDRAWAALVDPFGALAFEQVTEYWTVSEKNERLVGLTGALLGNRLLFCGLALGLLAFTFARFRMEEPLERSRDARPRGEPALTTRPALTPSGPGHEARPPHPLWLAARFTWLAFRETVRNVPFLVLAATGVAFILVAARVAGSIYGTPTYPVTYAMVELGSGAFGLFGLILVVLYAGELTWREREARLDQIVDALPVPTWILYGSKAAALLLVGVVLQLLVMACGLGIQIAQGYHRFELGLYVKELLGLRLVGHAQLVALALAVHAIVNHKHLGHFVLILHLVSMAALPRFGLEHKLYRYGADTGYVYSDMNGFGHLLGPWAWFNLYWTLGALGLALIGNLFVARGQVPGLRARLREARRRLTGRGARVARTALVATGVAFAATGTFIFVNTNVWNRYESSAERARIAVAYERTYKATEREAQPLITAVDVSFDLRPRTRSVRITGTYDLVNAASTPIPRVWVNLSEDARIHRLGLGALPAPTERDDRLAFHAFLLPTPLQPGATTRLAFDLEYAPRGFTVDGEKSLVVGNGTFLHNFWLPHIGYLPQAEVSDADERRKRGLPPRPRMADLDDPVGRGRNYVASDAHWVRLRASACTDDDQMAILPGRLLAASRGDGRACFTYGVDTPVLNFFSVLSARYATARDRWQGRDGKGQDRSVGITIHHHPSHTYDLPHMLRGVKDSLAYFSAQFSPYRHDHLRIVEFPRYQAFAQSFPSTIPYSEAIGFIAKVDPKDEDGIDYPYYVTAHEVAHQWWAHEVVGADVQGTTLLSESLAQYSALMVMKRAFGPKKMRRFLRHELDAYLRARGLERREELPLSRVEQQPYLHYNKGALAFYALADAVGEDAVNRALRAFLATWAGKGPPYARSIDLLAALRAELAPDQHGLLVDLFETITLWECRTLSAVTRQVPSGWETTLTFEAKKLRADHLGKEQEVALAGDAADEVDVGLVDEKGDALHLERLRLRPGLRETVIRSTGAERPARAGIDPLHKLIDRKPDDNVVAVSEVSEVSDGSTPR